jgi:hypothetical protein
MKYKILFSTLLMLAACSLPGNQPALPAPLTTDTPQVASIPALTFTPISTLTQFPAPTQTTAPTLPPAFCNDSRGLDLIKSFTSAISSKDGALLSSLVSPTRGLDVHFFRDGKAVNYDTEHAKFVFETTFQADWGLSFGSGEPLVGSFQEIVLPSLQVVFTPSAEIVCNRLKVGGATYVPEWPYPYLDYYSVHFAGTDSYGGLDWQTWAVGMDNVSGNFYLASLVHYVWEP